MNLRSESDCLRMGHKDLLRLNGDLSFNLRRQDILLVQVNTQIRNLEDELLSIKKEQPHLEHNTSRDHELLENTKYKVNELVTRQNTILVHLGNLKADIRSVAAEQLMTDMGFSTATTSPTQHSPALPSFRSTADRKMKRTTHSVSSKRDHASKRHAPRDDGYWVLLEGINNQLDANMVAKNAATLIPGCKASDVKWTSKLAGQRGSVNILFASRQSAAAFYDTMSNATPEILKGTSMVWADGQRHVLFD
ncbi:hypothetical protein B0H34DRAFT_797137 [Crassisporium funariophilum]|nr:hypothetical protein B0H34DRAFT_797137 [Crassisporium funariophilum]